MDPRANPTEFFGLKMGSMYSYSGCRISGLIHETGCVVIRNAGGRANQSVVNDILLLDSLRGITDVVITHHTGQSNILPRSMRETSLTVNDRLWNDTRHECHDP
jgi:hypothetical protein